MSDEYHCAGCHCHHVYGPVPPRSSTSVAPNIAAHFAELEAERRPDDVVVIDGREEHARPDDDTVNIGGVEAIEPRRESDD